MKTTTTTREYDADGHMVKETVTEYDSGPTVVGSYCSCHLNGYCPVHGYKPHWQVFPNIYPTKTTGTTFTINTASLKAANTALQADIQKLGRTMTESIKRSGARS